MPVSVAIVGAGPSGFYAAEALIKSGLDCRIDLIETLPTPFGLVRYGVAPDHQHTKRVQRAFEKTAMSERVRFFGNIQVGRDIALEKLRELYDAVILAIGAPIDRKLAIPGSDLEGVYGSADFVGWYNGHPTCRDLEPRLDTKAAAVIGNGNVAIDVARVLSKTAEEMKAADLPDYAAAVIHESPIEEVYLIGRRGPLEAKFTNVELRELGALEDCQVVIDPSVLPAKVDGVISGRDRRLKEKNLATLREFSQAPKRRTRRRLHLLFYARPAEVMGATRAEGLRLERTSVSKGLAAGTGEYFDLPCGLVVSAIGYRTSSMLGVPFDEKQGVVANKCGRVAERLYVVGWAKRGPTGVIGTNKPDGDGVAVAIAEDAKGSARLGRAGLQSFLSERGLQAVSYQDWKAIEAYEVATAPAGAPRRKLLRINDMLRILETGGGQRKAPR